MSVVFEPNQIRSTNAAFDPAKKDSSNLLASLGAGTVAGAGLLASDDSEAGVGKLAMDAASRMQRAKEQGFDTDNPIYSGTYGKKAKEILPYGKTSGDQPVNVFGGIFGSHSENTASSHGPTMQKFLTKNHINSDDIRMEAFYDDDGYEKASSAIMDVLKERSPDGIVTDEEVGEVMDFAFDGRNMYDLYTHVEYGDADDFFESMTADRADELFGRWISSGNAENIGEVSHDLQGLKGVAARAMGYDSVGMVDEHGESVLILNGRYADDAAFDPAKKDSSNLLASLGAGTLAGAGLLASDDSEAGAGKLAMDAASRMQRAKEQGFDTTRRVYHGTARL